MQQRLNESQEEDFGVLHSLNTGRLMLEAIHGPDSLVDQYCGVQKDWVLDIILQGVDQSTDRYGEVVILELTQ